MDVIQRTGSCLSLPEELGHIILKYWEIYVLLYKFLDSALADSQLIGRIH